MPKYAQESLRLALEATLLDKKNNKYTKASAGPPTVLSNEKEGLIVKWVHHLAEMGFPVTKDQLVNCVACLVKELKRPNHFKNGVPGRKWYEGFLKRNTSISLRVSQCLTVARASVTESGIRAWFDRIYKYIQHNDWLDVLENSDRIFNCDESAFFLCPKGQAVLAKRGSKNVYFRAGNDEKECLTLSIGASASGKMMPPFAIFPYKRLTNNILQKYSTDWAIGNSESGWMTSETFYEYIANAFYPFLVKEGTKLPVVLFLDGHTSHLSLHVCEFCKEHGIILVALLPNSTHLLQPMNVAVFHSLKIQWRKEIQNWRIGNNGQRLKRDDFAPIIQKCIDMAVTPEIIRNGFKACGLYPFNPDAVLYDAQKTQSDTQKMIKLFEERLPPEKFKSFTKCNGEWNGDVKDENLYYFWKSFINDQDKEPSSHINDLSISNLLAGNDLTSFDIENRSIDFLEECNVTTVDLGTRKEGGLETSTPTSNKQHSHNNVSHVEDFITCQIILNYASRSMDEIPSTSKASILASAETTNRKQMSKDSQFPTPFKNAFFWPDNMPSDSKKKIVKRKLTPTAAIASEYIEYQRRLDEEKKSKIEKLASKKEKKKDRQVNEAQKKGYLPKAIIKQADYVVIQYEGEKFPGKVLNIINGDPVKFQIKTMAMSGPNWRWPERDDILDYEAEEIIKKINPPQLINKRGVFLINDFY